MQALRAEVLIIVPQDWDVRKKLLVLKFKFVFPDSLTALEERHVDQTRNA